VSFTQQLYQLQQFDNQTDAANRRLQEIAASLVESELLKQARAELEGTAAAHSQTRALMNDLDLEVKGLQQKITQHERR